MIVVTGAGGFIGGRLVEELAKRGVECASFSNHKHQPGVAADCGYLNLLEPESFQNLPQSFDTMIHLAAITPRERGPHVPFSKMLEANAVAIKGLVAEGAKRGMKRFIFASSQMVVERPLYLPVDEKHPFVTLTDYGLSKAVGEKYTQEICADLDIETLCLRLSGVYGPGELLQYVFAVFLNRAMADQPITVFGRGAIRRDMLYIKDALRAILLAAGSSATGVVNIGSGQSVSILEMAQTMADLFGKGKCVVSLVADREEAGYDYEMNIEKASKELGFVPQFNFREGMQDYKAVLAQKAGGIA